MKRVDDKKVPQIDVLDLSNMPDMDELLGIESADDGDVESVPDKSEPGTKSSSASAQAGKRQERSFKPAILDTKNVPDMESLLNSSGAVVSGTRDIQRNPTHADRKKSEKTGSARMDGGGRLRRKKRGAGVVVVDGSNVTRLGMDDKNYSSLRQLLALVVALAGRGMHPVVVVDANERYMLRSNPDEPQAAAALLELVRNLPECFRESPIAVPADKVILRIADEKNALIVSNDSFTGVRDSYASRHSWLSACHDRIVNTRLAGDFIKCPRLNVSARWNKPLRELVDACFIRMHVL